MFKYSTGTGHTGHTGHVGCVYTQRPTLIPIQPDLRRLIINLLYSP